jgi:hypothetical protein
MRALFFDEDVARLVVARLVADGFEATTVREPFAGEDDDEDHPWAVTTDAPGLLLELLVDAHDGWLEVDEPAAQPVVPLELPRGPRRVRGDN